MKTVSEKLSTDNAKLKRTILDAFIGTLNTWASLVTVADLSPVDAYDGDRMRIEGAMAEICKAIGSGTTFPKYRPSAMTASREKISTVS